MQTKTLTFPQLTISLLYQILQARSAVFVLEQDCAYQDIDGVDKYSQHIIMLSEKSNDGVNDNNQLIAYCRIIPPEHSHSARPEIGRVLVLPDYRGQGLAKQLMLSAIDYCFHHFPHQSIKISAQTYLTAFYQSLGFEATSNAYLEDGIEHIDMSRIVKV